MKLYITALGSPRTAIVFNTQMPYIFIPFFSNKTQDEALARFRAGHLVLSHSVRVKKIRPGDIIVMSNTESRAVFGIARAESQCLDIPLSDFCEQVYTGSDTKYNKHSIPIMDLVVFPQPITYTELGAFLEVDDYRKNSNIYKNNGWSWRRAFTDRDDRARIIMQLHLWIDGMYGRTRTTAPEPVRISHDSAIEQRLSALEASNATAHIQIGTLIQMVRQLLV